MDPDTAPAKAILQRWSKVRRPIEEALGLKKGQKAILGCYNGNPVYAKGSKNYIEKVCEMGEGKLGIEVRETVGCGTGTRIDAGVKDLISGQDAVTWLLASLCSPQWFGSRNFRSNLQWK